MTIAQRTTTFAQSETASGQLLVAAAVLALIANYSPLTVWYDARLSMPLSIQVGEFSIAKPLLLWINDGLVAIFFS